MDPTIPEDLDRTVIHFAVWRWALQTPDAIAIRDQGREYSYRDLAQRVDALAQRLVHAGVGRDVLVGISIERSADLIIGALAILRAGGAYVPIDPAYPADRRDFLIADSKCAVLLTQSRLLPLYQGSQARVLLVDPEPASAVEAPAADREAQPALPDPMLADDSLAYVIYTSGSTGRPKGVCVTHQNLLRLFRQTEDWYHFGPRDRIPLFHSFSFDYSVWEMWTALLYGGCLVIVPLSVVRDPIAFHQLVAEEGITVLNQTPSEWQLFVRADQLAQESAPVGLGITLPALRYVMLGGEALDLRRLQPWFDRHGDQHPQLVNLYGITETTVIITARPLSRRDQQDSRSLIGIPIPDLTLHILDSAGQPVADGQEGELWVGGQGVARGYLRRPDLTEARFRPDPFSNDAQARLYRTGDLVRRGPDGELEYLGRIDLQVKLGGHRIELGEIEAVLREDPAVADVAVLARQIQQGPAQLVAYVVSRAAAALDTHALREQLRKRLPEYMCPATWVTLEQLPLTVNGKLDRDALPLPIPTPMPQSDQAAAAAPSPAASSTEQVIARLFQEALGLPSMDPNADFFASGGTSLAAMQLSLRIAETLGVLLPTGGIFRYPTATELSAQVDRSRAQHSAPAEASADQPTTARPSEWHPLSPMQEQVWFVQTLAPSSTTFHCPIAFQITGALDVPRLIAALNRAATRHPLLRAQFSVVHGRPMQKIAANPTWQVQVGEICEDENPPHDALQLPLVQEFLHRPFDLSQSAATALVLQMNRQSFLFLILLHHIVTDGWSVEQLLRELSQDYEGSPVPAPRQTFFQCVAQQESQRSPTARKDSEAYFTSQLADAPATSEILGDFPRPTTASLRGRLHPFTLPVATRAALAQLAQREGVSPNILLFTALFALLHRYTGQKDLVIGLPYAGRDLPGSEAVQGPLLSLLPVRVQLTPGISFRSLVRLVRAQAHAAYCHSVLPFSQVRSLLKLQHETTRHPLFQVSYAPQPGKRGHLVLADLQVAPLFVDPGKSQYDLTLYAWPAQDDLPLELEYASDLYSDATIRQLVTHFQRLLDAGLQQADVPLAQLPMLTGEERQTLLGQWSGTNARPAAQDEAESVLSRFRHHVRTQPDAAAVRYGEESISYRQLDSWSDRIAWALHEQQLPRDTRVALSCPRSPDAIAGILGAWKAGVAYVPLDPAYPEARLLWMLEDSGAALVLTTHEAGGLRTPNHRHLYIDAQRPRPDGPRTSTADAAPADPASAGVTTAASVPAASALPDPSPETLAYIIYTSGSTGLPKGVLIEHRSIAALSTVIPRVFPLAAGERLLQFASLSFDWSVADLLIALTQGGTLVLPTARFGLAGRELVDLLARERIALVLLPPSVLSQLPDHPLPDLRLLLAGGERCPASIVKRWSQGRIFRNAYGPTETTIVATVHDCHPDEHDPAIGRPLPGAVVYVLDADGQQVPPLVPGELYIGGLGLARGYHARPDLSAARFPENMTDVAGRLYRTGDIVRFRHDGSLEFLGRKDDQRKLRGFRIELGEVEAALRAAPGVQTAVAWIDGEGASARLLGYVVRSSAASDSPAPAPIPPESEFLAELRVRLRSQLPPQLVPSDLIVLDALPLTPNGKLNPAALPRVAASQTTATAGLNEWEALVAEVWQSVLGRSVSRTANFFDVGGSSLRLIEVQALLETRLGTRVALADLFAHPTIEAMGALISRGRSRGQDMQRQSQERAERAVQHRPQGRPRR